MLRFFLTFMGLLISLFTLQILTWVQQHVIFPFTGLLAKVSVFIIELFDDGVVASERIVRSIDNGFAVEIAPGCNGVEAMIILLAAIAAFPSTWRQKLIGLSIGFFAIQGLNLVRIISLFYLGQWNYTWFEWAHLYIWQALIILDALVVFLLWLRWISKPGPGTPPSVDYPQASGQAA
jgi:exosortase H (IPTLxxWG-CTERM-specific)